LWFGTNRGVFSLDPRRIVTNEVPPTIVLTDLHAGVTRYEPHTALRLPAHSTAVQFDYTATNLAIARRAHFQYRLDGVDADWQDAGARREAFYTNLGPGQYRFHLKASNENGVWSPEAVAAEFTILPAWYQTNWFNALCVAAGITMLVLMYRMRFAQVRSQLQGRLQERTLERERIARELHDTLLQSFQGIVLLFGATIQRLPSEHPTRDLMSRALVRANEVLGEARDRVSGLRNSQDLPNDLPAALEQAAHDLLHVQPVEFAMSVTGLRRTLHAVVMEEAYQIGREALANAQRHANAQHIRLEVTFGARRLQLRVQDDGNGFDAEILQRKAVAGHWGIPGMRERADKLSAKLSIRSQPGGGTEVDLQIPATVAYRHQAQRPGWRRFFFRGNG
jgi:signal transduction histidine kinase